MLADAVATSFEWAGFTPAQLLQGPISITDLAWQAPPLQAECQFLDLPLHTYLDYPLVVRLEQLYDFYDKALYYLHTAPEEISNKEGYKKLGGLMPRAYPGDRNLVFPLPEGWPVGQPTTGHIFALEAARLCKTSMPEITGFVSDANSYYAQTSLGPVGVKDGFPTLHAQSWDVDCSGMVQGMLAMPRGRVTTDCHYDLIARLRSVLHTSPELFEDFEAVDYTLQTLRILSDGETCKPLLQAINAAPQRLFRRKAKVTAFQDAVKVMEDWQYTDRTKISMLLEILVPTHFSLSQFCIKIINVERILPATLSEKKERRIIATLKYYAERANKRVSELKR